MKPNSYSQLYIQVIFSPKDRNALLAPEIQEEVFGYISGTITNKGCKSIIINGMPDHVHILLGLDPGTVLNDLVRHVKRSSSLFINEKKLTAKKFAWQEGYGAFSYSRSHLEKVYDYILNQKIHHAKRSFQEEYTEFLRKYAVDYDSKYLFEFFPEQ